MPIGFLTDDVLKDRANEFLGMYHPSRSIPVPIESIVELGMRMNILPIPNLRRTADVEAFTTSDLSTICVDEYMLLECENRYRFSLAHEAAHVFLHAEIVKGRDIRNTADWREYVEKSDGKEYARLEFQANRFAGLVLAPTEHLRRLWFDAVTEVPAELKRADMLEDAYRYVAMWIAPDLGMSPESVSICLACEKPGWSNR